MIRTAPSACADCLHRIKAWLAVEATTDSKRRVAVAKQAGVHEKTLRLATEDAWNPTVKTLQKLEGIIPPDWQPPKKNGNGKRARAS